jgi:(2Fe-2S) ferredoxin
MSYYEKHIFVCENQRAEGERQSCGASNSAILKYMKSKCKSHYKGDGKIRIQRAGCLDRCEEGPILVCYPEEKWYSIKSKEEADRFLLYFIGEDDPTAISDLEVNSVEQD